MTYCIYHIPGKKIGVTTNLDDRVTKQQGYAVDEYEVLEMSDDIKYISDRERELQRMLGYKVDTTAYKDLKPNKTKTGSMKLNVTEQTTTFPCSTSDLRDNLRDNMYTSWETEHGEFQISPESQDWIMKNVKTSYYNKGRSFIYNKAMAKWLAEELDKYAEESRRENRAEKIEELRADLEATLPPRKEVTVFDDIRQWAEDRGIFKKGDTKTQYLKLMEEAGELGRAILKDDREEFIDAIGDMVVVLTNLAHLGNESIEGCTKSAYDVIAKRSGKMVNGTFVKD